MMELKDNFIVNYNHDNTITIYDFINEEFSEFDEISSYIFKNIDKNNNELADKLLKVYKVKKEIILLDIKEVKEYIIGKYMILK